jgi:hypothetical protein
MLISTHLRITAADWRAVDSTGYCGYEMLCPSAPLVLSDETTRIAMRDFLVQLLPQCPDTMEEARTRTSYAIDHLLTPTPLPRHAWCHMDIALHLATTVNRPFWTPGKTPVHSPNWVGQRDVGILDMEGLGILFNAVDHFSVVDPHIPAASLTEACRILELAVAGEPIPAEWTCIQGTAHSNPLAIQISIDQPSQLAGPTSSSSAALHSSPMPPVDRHLRFNPVMHLLTPPPQKEITAKKHGALMATRNFFLNLRTPPSRPVRSLRVPRKSYVDQL